ncbi:MAG TPA: protein kinase [Candidatus Acidoferrales bacterium]|nr:protein kinase [Candidatus Acidoferrales bacterium]
MIGKTLSHYRIAEQIGAGGMGVVYRARDDRLNRDVALKILPSGTLADEAARRRFRNEAMALSQLNHPNIATVHDFDTQDGVDFLVMEYVKGESLAERLARSALAEKEVAALGVQIAEALEEAHEQRVVHRDLKPGNIIVTPKGRAKILDFGLAKLLQPAAEKDLTRSLGETQSAAGTLPYMSPEQLRGDPADSRSDIFSFGAVLYEMATARRAFDEENSSRLIDAILNQPPVAPRAVNGRISPELERIILKCLEKEPESRYQSAKEAGVDLRRLGTAATQGVSTPEPAAAAGQRHKMGPIWVGIAAVAVVVIALAALKFLRWPLRSTAGVSPGEIKSLAVLPLENYSGDASQDYFADGMTEALIADLAQISALRVISRTSVMQYKGTKKLLPEIAKELNVDAVIEGSVERAGNRVRITAQLIRAANDMHLWAQSYEGDLRDVLALQDQVAQKIAGEVRVNLTAKEQQQLTSAGATDPEAYQYYLQGRFLWNRGDEPDLKKSIDYYNEALAKQPNYALAYAGLADTYEGFSDWYLPPKESMPKAKEAALKALSLDDSLAAAHNSLCAIYTNFDWNWEAADKECRRAIELSPNFADAHDSYAVYLGCVGQWEKALVESQRAEELDPLNYSFYTHEAFNYFLERKYEKAVERARKSIELEPDYFLAHSYLGLTYAQMGRPSEAVAEARKGSELSDSPLAKGFLGYVYAAAGQKREATEVANDLTANFKAHFVCPFEIGMTYLYLGKKDDAFAWIERAYEERSICIPSIKYDPRLDPIRSDLRFKAIISRVNFPE